VSSDRELTDLANTVLGELHLASDVAVAHLAVQERSTQDLFWITAGRMGFIPAKRTAVGTMRVLRAEDAQDRPSPQRH